MQRQTEIVQSCLAQSSNEITNPNVVIYMATFSQDFLLSF